MEQKPITEDPDLSEAQAARMRIDSKLLQAIASGASTPMAALDWLRVRRAGIERAAAERGKFGTQLD